MNVRSDAVALYAHRLSFRGTADIALAGPPDVSRPIIDTLPMALFACLTLIAKSAIVLAVFRAPVILAYVQTVFFAASISAGVSSGWHWAAYLSKRRRYLRAVREVASILTGIGLTPSEDAS